MRTPKLIVLAAIPLILALGCKKGSLPILSLSSVTVVNAMPTSNAIVSKFGSDPSQYYSGLLLVYYGGSQLYSAPTSSNSLRITPITDTAFSILQTKLPLVSGGIYSIFLAGDTTKPDTMLVKDDIPTYSDSSIGMRFVNLTTDGKAISINLVGNDPISQAEINSLGHLQITSFKKYSANSSSPTSYTFEIHDQASGALLTTFTWYYTVYKNNTLVLSGSVDPTSPTPIMAFSVNNF